MKQEASQPVMSISVTMLRRLVAILCAALLVPGNATLLRSQTKEPTPDAQKTPKIAPEQLDSLVAPIALYPDPMLVQVLAASTYPLEII
jgi:hypothetical protein